MNRRNLLQMIPLPFGAKLIQRDQYERDDYKNEITGHRYPGIGVMWKTPDGEHRRTCVLLPENPTIEDVLEAWDLLSSAVQNPTRETCAFGEEQLTGREQKVSSLKNADTTEPTADGSKM